MTVLTAVPERPILDLALIWFDFRKGPLRCIGTWLRQEPYRPCMVLVPSDVTPTAERVVPCIIVLDDAWEWTEEYGSPEACSLKITHWLHSDYLPGSVSNDSDYYRIFDFVRAHLNDLINMPPNPVKRDRIAGDITFRGPDGEIIQKDILDDV